jgi:hypothetical protein
MDDFEDMRPVGEQHDLGGDSCPVCGLNTPDPGVQPACYVAYSGRREGCPGGPPRREKLAADAGLAQDDERAAAIRASNLRAAADGIL